MEWELLCFMSYEVRNLVLKQSDDVVSHCSRCNAMYAVAVLLCLDFNLHFYKYINFAVQYYNFKRIWKRLFAFKSNISHSHCY
jgi:hypothetical protein